MKKVLFLNFIVMSTFNLAHPVTPQMLIDKGAPLYLNGILYALMSLSMFLFSPFWGQKIDQYGTKKFMMFAPFCYGVMQLVFGFGPSSLLMGIGRFVSGVFSAAWIVALLQHVNLISTPEAKGKHFGYIMVTNGLGGVVGQMFAGKIGAINEQAIYYPFILQFIFGVLITFIVLFTVKSQHNENFSKSMQKQNLLSSYRFIREVKIMPILIVMLTLAIANNLYTSHIGFFLAEEFNYGSIGVSLVNSYSNLIIMLANLFLISIVKRKIGVLRGIEFEFIFALIAFSSIFFLPLNVAMVLIGIFIAAVAIYRPLVQDYILQSHNQRSGEVMGIINSTNSLGMIVGSLTSGFLFNYGSYYPFYAIIFVLISGLFIFKIFVKKPIK